MKIQMPASRQAKIEMVPLIDTFFLLLAFFISSVLTMEVVQGLPVELPREGGAAHRIEPDRILVTLTENGLLQFEGEPVTSEQLRFRLEQSPRKGTLHVALRADRGTPYEQVVQALGVIQGAGVRRVSLLTQPEPRQKSRP